MTKPLQPSSTAFVIVDMQNDFIHPNGAYGRAGQTSDSIAALPQRLNYLAKAVHAVGSWILSTHFTLVPGKAGMPLISDHLRTLRPFLGKGDFAPGSFGHDLIEELKPADLKVEKVAFSAFYQSRMDWMLHHAGVRTLIFGGILTNGGVASTVRDAHVHGFEVSVLSDGCAAFDQRAHDVNLEALGSIARLTSCAELIDQLSG